MHTYTSTSQEELGLGSLWSIKVIGMLWKWTQTHISDSSQLLKTHIDLDCGLPALHSINKDAFLILACKEKKCQNSYHCLYLNRLGLRTLKSHPKLQASWSEGEGFHSSEVLYNSIYPTLGTENKMPKF